MAELGKLFVDLALAAGIPIDADNLAELTTSTISVPDSVASSLKSNLMTEEAAKNNGALKRHFTAQVLNTVDATMADFVNEYGDFTDDHKGIFDAEKSSYKRLPLLLKTVKQIEAAKGGTDGGDPQAKAKLEKMKTDLEALNGQIVTLKESHQAEITNATQTAERDHLDFAISSELLGKTYANAELDKPTNVLIARQILDAKLAEVGAKIVKGVNGSPRLVQADNPEMDFMRDNKKVELGSFTDSTLSEKKLLKVATPGNQGTPPGSPGSKRIIDEPAPSGAHIPNNDAIIAEYDKQLGKMGVTVGAQ